MAVGLLLVGSLGGALSALAALIIGYSLWVALLVYSGAGMLFVLAGALALIAQDRRAEQTCSDLAAAQHGS
jgi:hypothetical protein